MYVFFYFSPCTTSCLVFLKLEPEKVTTLDDSSVRSCHLIHVSLESDMWKLFRVDSQRGEWGTTTKFRTFLPAFTCWLNPPRKLDTRYTFCVSCRLSFKCTWCQRFKDGIFVKRSWLTLKKETSFALFRLCDVSAAFLFSRLFPSCQPHPTRMPWKCSYQRTE